MNMNHYYIDNKQRNLLILVVYLSRTQNGAYAGTKGLGKKGRRSRGVVEQIDENEIL